MPMPHRTFVQVAKRRLVGKVGVERVRVLRGLIEELPDYRSGPYADIRKWLTEEIEQTRVRAKVVHRDSIAVRREGAAQVALVGAPNAGKSSLLQALSQIQIKTGDYAFTTTRPIAAVTSVGGVRVQLVEIPGLLEGASEGRGGGRALLGVLRNADAIVYCHAASLVAGGPDRSASRGRGGRHRAARSARGDQGGRGRRARRPSRGRVRRSRARARVGSRRCEPRQVSRGGLASSRAHSRLPPARREASTTSRSRSSRERPSRMSPTRSTTSSRRAFARHASGARRPASTGSASGALTSSPTSTRWRSSTDDGAQTSRASRSSTVSRRRMTVASPSRTRIAAGRGTPL